MFAVACAVLVGGPAVAASVDEVAKAHQLGDGMVGEGWSPPCTPGDTACDADGDRIPDAVEVQVCGDATCVTGFEDIDVDGVPDWVEWQATGTATGADPTADGDKDGITDYVEVLVCGGATCAKGREDVDADGVPDWIEVLICGDTTCATGKEDLNANGVMDAEELMACLVESTKADPGETQGDPSAKKSENGSRKSGPLASTGAQIGLALVLAILLLAVGVAARLWATRRTPAIAGEGDGDSEAEL